MAGKACRVVGSATQVGLTQALGRYQPPRQLETIMVELFDNDEASYLKWVQANPHGFVANVDRAGTVPQYPMVHAATHGLMSSPKIGNFTTGAYIKFCCTDLAVMEQHSQTKFGRPLTRCSQCM